MVDLHAVCTGRGRALARRHVDDNRPVKLDDAWPSDAYYAAMSIECLVTFELQPSSMFGLPQDQHTVLPSGTQRVEGAAYHRSGIRAGWGTISRYRPDDDKLTEEFTISGLAAAIVDNFLRILVTPLRS